MLKNFGYHGDVAANGREALRALEILPYDLILMDCQMPEMDGYEATQEIRARDWPARRIPIIALTAHATRGERDKCLRAGMDDYISKPVEKENLRQTVAYWLVKAEEREVEKLLLEPEAVPRAENSPFGAVDFATLDEITDNDAEMKREVVEIYLQQTVVNLSEIELALRTSDAQKLYEVAHKTVGGSALCGMTAIVAPMRRLEQLGRDGLVAEAAPFFAEAQNAFAAIDRECRENIQGINNF
jgi:CheY-like chemotaxis protein/HPt (histidine-containing phosphotransfer) domain-containing protein